MILSAFPVTQFYSGVPNQFLDYSVTQCQQGITWNWDSVDFEFISPRRDSIFEGNNVSCVLKVSSANGSLLLPADIEKDVERSLLRYSAEKLVADVLIAPHHGSKTSSTEGFIAKVKPRYVLYPVGYRNKFGFPKDEVVSRYVEHGAVGFNTASHGAVSITFLKSNVLTLERFRSQNSMFWSWKE